MVTMRTFHVVMLVVSLVGSCGARAEPGRDDVSSSKTRIRLLASGVEATVSIDDTPAGRDFLASLPLTVTLKDHNGTEKIASLPRKLSMRGAPAGMDPSVGDFTYHAPWAHSCDHAQ